MQLYSKARNRGFVDNGRRIDKFQKKDDRTGYCRKPRTAVGYSSMWMMMLLLVVQIRRTPAFTERTRLELTLSCRMSPTSIQ